MSGDIYFRNNLHKFSFGVSYNFFDVILGIKSSITLPVRFHIAIRQNFAIPPSTYFRQLGILLYFYSPALIFSQMPMKTIHFISRHDINHPFYLIFSEKVPALVQHKAPPFETGNIFYFYGRNTPLLPAAYCHPCHYMTGD